MRDEFRDLLQMGDVWGLVLAWGRLAPHLPQPKNIREAEITMHHARTQSERITKVQRAYSHRWLTERGYPSGLPEALWPAAEQVHGKIVSAVGIAVMTQTPELEPVARQVEKAMADAVADCYANGDTEPVIVQARMAEARTRTMAQLLAR